MKTLHHTDAELERQRLNRGHRASGTRRWGEATQKEEKAVARETPWYQSAEIAARVRARANRTPTPNELLSDRAAMVELDDARLTRESSCAISTALALRPKFMVIIDMRRRSEVADRAPEGTYSTAVVSQICWAPGESYS